MNWIEILIGYLQAYWWYALLGLLAVFAILMLIELGRWRSMEKPVIQWFRSIPVIVGAPQSVPVFRFAHRFISRPRFAIDRIRKDLSFLKHRYGLKSYSNPELENLLISPREWYVKSRSVDVKFDFELNLQNLLESALSDLKIETPEDEHLIYYKPPRGEFLTDAIVIALKWVPFLILSAVINITILSLSYSSNGLIPQWFVGIPMVIELIVALVIIFYWIERR